jgi:hypothetical protein
MELNNSLARYSIKFIHEGKVFFMELTLKQFNDRIWGI